MKNSTRQFRTTDRNSVLGNTDEVVLPKELLSSIQKKIKNNYFGLPLSSFTQTANALAYQGRKAVDWELMGEEEDSVELKQVNSEDRTHSKAVANNDNFVDMKVQGNHTAQRKVASALLTMVKSALLETYFLHKGGLEAVLTLINESKDSEVLTTCSDALVQASLNFQNCRVLLQKNIMGAISKLIETRDEQLCHLATNIISNLCSSEGEDDLLCQYGIVGVIQTMLGGGYVHRTESICFLLLAMSNVASVITGPDAEMVMRLCFVTTKKIDLVRVHSKAMFLADMFTNYSRAHQYSALLVEEGVLPLLLHLMDTHPQNDLLVKVTETFSNISLNRKNRREIASCGIASRLMMIFDRGSPPSRASALQLVGNLLFANMLHEKVATVPIVNCILNLLHDVENTKQVIAAAYCCCQLSRVYSSCEVLVECDVVRIVLGLLRTAPAECMDNLWNILVNTSNEWYFFPSFIADPHLLITELYEETRFDASTEHQLNAVVQLSFNLSCHEDFAELMSPELIQKFVTTLKTVFSSRLSARHVQLLALDALIRFIFYCRPSRSIALGNDLLDLFKDGGTDDGEMNIKYAALLNIISCDESCVYRLLDQGILKMLVSLQEAFNKLCAQLNLSNSSAQKKKQFIRRHRQNKGGTQGSLKLEGGNSASGGGTMGVTGGEAGDAGDDAASQSQSGISLNGSDEGPVTGNKLGEWGRELTAAILHNLALKRPSLAPGVLQCIMSLARNCKTIRVLHAVRCLACISNHPKSKVALSKECERVFPMLTVIMRSGCEEAELVQHYSGVALCNILAMPLQKQMLLNLISVNPKAGQQVAAVTDLVVVTLLRINSPATKESLCKAFFNLLARVEIREQLLTTLDMVSAVMELCKSISMSLLELGVRILYNVSCELKAGSGVEDAYAEKMSLHSVCRMMVGRLIYSDQNNDTQLVATKPIRILLGMTVANMSFNKQLVYDLAMEKSRIADALYRVFVLGTDEAAYCAVATVYNLSGIPECVRLVDEETKVLQLLVDVNEREGCTVQCIQLSVATLCRFSLHPIFHEHMCNPKMRVLALLIKVLGAPQLHMSVKKDAVQCVYNIVSLHSESRALFIEGELVVSLWKFLKVQNTGPGAGGAVAVAAAPTKTSDDSSVGGSEEASMASEDDETNLLLISHIVKELCEEIGLIPAFNARPFTPEEDAVRLKLQKKAMADGILNVILKLSKIEIPIIKLDMSFAIYSLTRGQDLLRVLNWDSVDVLFWLTLHDTLGMQDVINKNVSRALRTFALSEECRATLAKQERFLPVLKALMKSRNQDVLWQTAGSVYNLMQSQSSLDILKEKGGLIANIFEIAERGDQTVQHVCSACLHIVPDMMPSMDDPKVLALVLCLLEANGDKFAQLTELPRDAQNYKSLVEPMTASAAFKHTGTTFEAGWNPLVCILDTVYVPAMVYTPQVDDYSTNASFVMDLLSHQVPLGVPVVTMASAKDRDSIKDKGKDKEAASSSKGGAAAVAAAFAAKKIGGGESTVDPAFPLPVTPSADSTNAVAAPTKILSATYNNFASEAPHAAGQDAGSSSLVPPQICVGATNPLRPIIPSTEEESRRGSCAGPELEGRSSPQLKNKKLGFHDVIMAANSAQADDAASLTSETSLQSQQSLTRRGLGNTGGGASSSSSRGKLHRHANSRNGSSVPAPRFERHAANLPPQAQLHLPLIHKPHGIPDDTVRSITASGNLPATDLQVLSRSASSFDGLLKNPGGGGGGGSNKIEIDIEGGEVGGMVASKSMSQLSKGSKKKKSETLVSAMSLNTHNNMIVSGEVPSEPVVSTKSGFVFERRLIQKHFQEVGDGKCPISGIPMGEEDLIAIKGSKIVRPRPLTATSIPGILSVFQNEWDELMLETFTLKSQLDATRQELSHSLYQHDAACRVIARLMRERDEAQTLVASLQAAGYIQSNNMKDGSSSSSTFSGAAALPQSAANSSSNVNASGPMDSGTAAQNVETGVVDALDAAVVEGITNKFNELSAARKARKKAGGSGDCVASRESVGTYALQQTITPHKADPKTGVTCMAVCDKYNISDFSSSSNNGGSGSTNSSVVLTGASDKTAALADSSSGRVLARLTGHTKKVNAVAFHSDPAANGHLFTASADKTVKMWQPVAAPAKGRGKAAAALNFEVAFSWDSNSSSDATDYGEVVGMAVHPYGGVMLCASQNQAWHIVDTLEGRTLVSKASSSSNGGGGGDDSETYTCCGLHPDGLILGVGTSRATLQVWDVRQQSNVAMLIDDSSRGGAVRDLCFSENGYNVASGTEEGMVKIWDLRKLSCSTTIKLGEQPVNSVCYDPSSAFLAAGGAGSAGGDINVLLAKEWTSVLTVPAVHNKVVTAVRWAADSGSIYSSAMDRTVKVFSVSA